MIPDKEVNEKLVDQVADLLKNDNLKKSLAENILEHGHPNATNQIALEVISLASS